MRGREIGAWESVSALLSILFGIYLLIVVIKGKASDLISFISKNKAFGKYIVAWIVLYIVLSLRDTRIEGIRTIGEILNILFPLIVLGWILMIWSKAVNEFNKLMQIFK